MTAPVDLVYVRDRSSGRIHKRVRIDGTTLQSFEADNADEAGAYDVIPEQAIELAEPEDLCRRCFGKADEE